MGLSASQARLLSITARLSNNELQSQQIANSKVRLSNRTQEASAEYMAALSQQSLVYTTYNEQGESTQASLTAGLIYTYGDLKNQYGITNTAGQLLVSSTDATNFENSTNMSDFVLKYCSGLETTDNAEYYTLLEEIENLKADKTAKDAELAGLDVTAPTVDVQYKYWTSAQRLAPNASTEGLTTVNDKNGDVFVLGNIIGDEDGIVNTQFDTNRVAVNGVSGAYAYNYNTITIATGKELSLFLGQYLTEPTAVEQPATVKKPTVVEKPDFAKPTEADKPDKSDGKYSISVTKTIADIVMQDARYQSAILYDENNKTSDGSKKAMSELFYNMQLLCDIMGPGEYTSLYNSNVKIIHFDGGDTEAEKFIYAPNKMSSDGYIANPQLHNLMLYYQDLEMGDAMTSEITDLLAELMNQIDSKYNNQFSSTDSELKKYDSTQIADCYDFEGLHGGEEPAIMAYAQQLKDILSEMATYNVTEDDRDVVMHTTSVDEELYNSDLADYNSKVQAWEEYEQYLADLDRYNQYLVDLEEYNQYLLDLEVYNNNCDSNSLLQRKKREYSAALATYRTNNNRAKTLRSEIADLENRIAMKEAYSRLMSRVSVVSYDDDASAQWYINLWHRMNGESEYKSPEGQNGQYYKKLDDNLLNSKEWLQFALEHGVVTLEQVKYVDKSENETGLKNVKWTSTSYASCADISSVDDDRAIALAEAQYTKKLNEIEAKDKKYDTDIKKLDTEHSALQTEYESVKSVIDKNAERSFKAFS